VNIASVEFRSAALRAAQFPREWFPHVAFAGRSNVGKSSLLNWLLRRTLARVAKAPGKTRTLNFYLVNGSFFLVDLPGYGYAKVSGALRAEWTRELARYLEHEERLAGVVSLIDIRHGPTPLDLELHELLLAAGRERVVVLTKADKVGRGQQVKTQREVQLQLGLHIPPLVTSVRSGAGRGELLERTEEMLVLWRDRQRGQ
jgi:GTP-binding protein